MTEQEIKSNNRLIAEFMGYKFGVHKFLLDEGDEFNYKFKPYYNGIRYKDKLPENTSNVKNGHDFHEYFEGYDETLDYNLIYHSSWEQLMPVLFTISDIKIDGIPVKYKISDEGCGIFGGFKFEYTDNGANKKEIIWNAVVKFIKWYNSCQKEK